ncbi:MAG: hypothetical protein AAF298_20295 [Cyanobacteria bacterium P01_A01_bin.40]
MSNQTLIVVLDNSTYLLINSIDITMRNGKKGIQRGLGESGTRSAIALPKRVTIFPNG